MPDEIAKLLSLLTDIVEWMPDGHLRQASFVGLRDDKAPAEIAREE
jgi:hypothetical protein